VSGRLPEPWDHEPPMSVDDSTLRQVHAVCALWRIQGGRGDIDLDREHVHALVESLTAELLWHRRHSFPWPWYAVEPPA
jgi:hypothetical protein